MFLIISETFKQVHLYSEEADNQRLIFVSGECVADGLWWTL